jgi:ribonuclease PH
MKKKVAAVSAGIYKDTACLDLNYIEDRDATVDANIVMTEDLDFVEVQSAGEEATYSQEQLQNLLDVSKKGIQEIVALQDAAIKEAEKQADANQLASLAEYFGAGS